MFGPNTAQSIEMSAKLRRAEDVQWAANERLARSVRKSEPSWMARQVVGLLGLIRGRTTTAPVTPALSLKPEVAASEDDLFNASGPELRAA